MLAAVSALASLSNNFGMKIRLLSWLAGCAFGRPTQPRLGGGRGGWGGAAAAGGGGGGGGGGGRSWSPRCVAGSCGAHKGTVKLRPAGRRGAASAAADHGMD